MSASPNGTIVLESEAIRIEVDPGRGADVLSLVHRDSNTEVLFSTPWRARADDIRNGVREPGSSDSVMSWMEQYRGGWQTLFPNAGEPRVIAGATVGFHGEASISAWDVVNASAQSATLALELFSVPVAMERTVSVFGGTLQISDTLRNLSAVRIEADYVSHPAFGGDFLAGRCTIDTGARTFTVDPTDAQTGATPGSSHQWPWLTAEDGTRRHLSELTMPGQSRSTFGWLSDFDAAWASIKNHDLGLTALLEWDAAVLPYAWVWEELNQSAGFPWFGRARVIAIEPASTQTSGPTRASVLALEAFESAEITVRLSVNRTSSDPRETTAVNTHEGENK